jgi:aspartate aminotransferase/aromatic-amino-acid transaminase
VEFYNKLSEKGPVVIINDMAYLDYDFDCGHATEYLGCFNEISENVAVMVAFSCSKLLTAYGMRLGALIALAKKDEDAEALSSTCIRYGRTNWGNVNNGLMAAFVEIMRNHREELIAEKQEAIESLKARSEAFVSGCRQQGVDIFPYLGGFFITLRVEDPALLDKFTEKLIEDHIYTVKYPRGIRFAICSMSLEDCKVAPARIRAALDRAKAALK